MVILIILAILSLLGVGLYISRSEPLQQIKKAILCIGIPSLAFSLFATFIILIAIPGSGDTADKHWIEETLTFWGLMTSWAMLWGIIVGSIVFGVLASVEHLKLRKEQKLIE